MKALKNIFKIDMPLEKRIFGLDVMRMIAIMLVLLVNGDPIVRKNFENFPRFWYIDGVEVFFVLSGFLIGTILIKTFERDGFNKSSLFHFWKFRWYRTLPSYFLILFITLYFVYISTNDLKGFNWKYFFFLQNFNSPMPAFFSVTWSLTVEEWFYISFPLTAILINKLFPAWSVKKVVLSTVICFLLFPLAIRCYLIISTSADGRYDLILERLHLIYDIRNRMICRLDSIAFGVLGAYLNIYHAEKWNKYPLPLFIIGLITYLTFMGLDNLHPILKASIRFSILAFCIFLTLPLASNIKVGSGKWAYAVTYVSMISYSMYLIHRTLIMDAIRIHGSRPFTDIQAILYYTLYFILVFVLSGLLYKYYELPMMKLRDKRPGAFPLIKRQTSLN